MEHMVLLDQKKEVEEEEREEKEDNEGSKVEEDKAEKSEDHDDSKVKEDNVEKYGHDGGGEEDDRAKEEKEEEDDDDDDDDDDRSNHSQESNEEDQDENTQVVDKPEKTINLPVSPKENKESDVLNLNNEVVKMRKEVKRVRALIIRKLTRKIGALKKKKGKDREVERNQKRADRLLEEIHAMKNAAPDLVTKMALQKRLIFEQVCKNPKSTITERAIARIASHPQFDKKILAIKTAVRAFKQERMNPKVEKKVKGQIVKVNPQSLARGGESDKEEEESTEEQWEKTFKKNEDGVLKSAEGATVAKPETQPMKAAAKKETADVPKKETPSSGSVKKIPAKSSTVKKLVKEKPSSKQSEKKPSAPQRTKNEEDSDSEMSDDEEKEYFDDSTEERFHKQSSQSEESDDDDGFFVGKVRKFKKNKKNTEQESGLGEKKQHEVKNDSANKVQTELDDLEARLKSKVSMQSVFCSTLSSPVQNKGRGAGRGRGWGKFRGQATMKGGPNRDFSRESKFPKQERGTERNSGFKYSKPEGSRSEPERGFDSFGRGRGRGRGDAVSHKDHGGRGGFTQQAPKQALHPSWEASKKRREQQGQIQAFQGKKIKFDDDD
ncbi:serum response factor-binding protein 1 [Betta splendens]|uniref:Serum response factor-binding protein 1 n=1 Tax=Betta splendens TaxID=158456 RepID=A0A6P7NXJ8_BETSP|nr:serum response factor-binding protein 1 [Betta splendens]XP_029022700.1 serum response factor-binding protein 1 [Betta splendens]